MIDYSGRKLQKKISRSFSSTFSLLEIKYIKILNTDFFRFMKWVHPLNLCENSGEVLSMKGPERVGPIDGFPCQKEAAN